MANSDLKIGSAFAIAGLRMQNARMRVIAENIANAESTAATPGGDPYRRKMVVFNPLTINEGAEEVRVTPQVTRITGEFRVEYNASHPAADAQGMVKYPNVNLSLESFAMKGAMGAYKKSLDVLRVLDDVERKTLDLLK